LICILLFFFPLFLGEKRKGEENNQNRDQKSCLSVQSFIQLTTNTAFGFDSNSIMSDQILVTKAFQTKKDEG
jgi:hypothetical protein